MLGTHTFTLDTPIRVCDRWRVFTRGDALRKLIKEAGATYEGIAAITAKDGHGRPVNKGTIDRIVMGKTKRPHASTMDRILAAIGRTEADLRGLLRNGAGRQIAAFGQAADSVSNPPGGTGGGGDPNDMKAMWNEVYSRLTAADATELLIEAYKRAGHAPPKAKAGGGS